MKRIQSAILITAALVLASCGGPELTKEEVIDYGEIGFSDIVSYIVVGYQTNWEDMDPSEEMKLSSVYAYCSPYCGERDRFTINESGTIIEEGSNSASDSFTKAFRIKKGKLVESKTMTFENCPMDFEMQTFESLARKSGQQLCGG